MILAIETSSQRGSVALGDGSSIIQSIPLNPTQRHSVSLFPALEQLNLQRHRLSEIRIGLGPGSFGGIRVAIAAAHGIALATGATIRGICSAELVAKKLPHVTRLGVFADARRNEAYLTLFEHGHCIRPTHIIPNNALETEISKTTLAVSADPMPLIPEQAVPEASTLLEIPNTFPCWINGPDLEPIYLREPVVTQ